MECVDATVMFTVDMATRARVRAPELIGKGGWLNPGDQPDSRLVPQRVVVSHESATNCVVMRTVPTLSGLVFYDASSYGRRMGKCKVPASGRQ